jgi:phage tail-like protein
MEIVLDPVVALLDNLPSHFDPGHAPADILVLLSNWLGLEEYESRPMHERRELVRRAAELALKRGTKLGLELALELNFPDIPMRVEDGGGVQQSAEPEGGKASAPPGFVVYCDVPLEEAKQREIARFISRQKPAHVPFKLRVKAPRTGAKKA